MGKKEILNRLAIDVYHRSNRLFDALVILISSQKDYSFKKPLLCLDEKVIFDKRQLRKNCVLLGIYLQHALIFQLTPHVSDISRFAISAYLLDEYPSETTEFQYAKLNQIYFTEMGLFDDIRNMKYPLHYGMPQLPQKDSFGEYEFHRYAVWLIENSLIERRPVFDMCLTTDVFAALLSWQKFVIEDIDRNDFVF